MAESRRGQAIIGTTTDEAGSTGADTGAVAGPGLRMSPSGATAVMPGRVERLLGTLAVIIEVFLRVVGGVARLFTGRRDELSTGRVWNIARPRDIIARRRAERTSAPPTKPVVRMLVNPISGEGRSLKALPHLRRALRKAGYRVRVTITRAAGQAHAELTRELARPEWRPDAVIAVGGDGTLNEVVNATAGTGVRTALYAAGTANMLSSEMELPRHPEAFAEMVWRGRTRKLDLGSLSCLAEAPPRGVEPRVAEALPRRNLAFHSFVGIGFDARVLEELQRERKGNIWLAAYTTPIYRVLKDYAFPPLRVEIDGELVDRDAGLVIVSNIKSYAYMEVARNAAPDDGLLSVCVFRRRSALALARYIWRAVTKDATKYADVAYVQGKSISVTCDGEVVPVQADGDPVGYLPARIETMPHALSLIVPETTAAAASGSGAASSGAQAPASA